MTSPSSGIPFCCLNTLSVFNNGPLRVRYGAQNWIIRNGNLEEYGEGIVEGRCKSANFSSSLLGR